MTDQDGSRHHQQSFFQNFIDVISLRVFQWRYWSHAWHDSNVDSFILSSEVNMSFQQKLGSLYRHSIHARDTAQCCRPCAKQAEPLFVKIGFILTNFWPPETRKALGARLQIASCANVHGSSHSWYGIVACFKLIRTCFSKFLLLQNWPRTVHLRRAQFPRICHLECHLGSQESATRARAADLSKVKCIKVHYQA